MGELALYIYQSEHEFILLKDLLKIPMTKQFVADNLGDYQELEDALKDVLISFYFKPVDSQISIAKTQDKKAEAIEFFHKSLQEFLAAERMWNIILEQFTEKTGRRNRFKLNDWKETLKIIWNLGSPKALSQDMVPYLIDLINNYQDEKHKQELADQMVSFLPDLIQQQFIYRYEASEEQEFPMKKGLQCFYLYWTVLSHLVPTRNYITEEIKIEFVHLLHFSKRVFGGFVNLIGAQLSGAYLSDANLSHADLNYADLNYADLSYANLSYVENLTYEQLASTKTLYQAKNIPTKILERLQKENPSLLEKPKDLFEDLKFKDIELEGFDLEDFELEEE